MEKASLIVDNNSSFRISYSHDNVPDIVRKVDGEMCSISVKRVKGASYAGEMYLSNAVKVGGLNSACSA